MEVQPLGDDGKFRHVLFLAAGVAGDEVGDELLAQSLFAVDAVEYLLELAELAERRLAHEAQHAVGGVLGCHFQAAADVTGDEFAGIVTGALVHHRVFARVQQQVVAHAAADERLLDAGQGVHRTIDVEQRAMVGVQVGAHVGVDARRAFALLALLQISASHPVHVGGGAA